MNRHHILSLFLALALLLVPMAAYAAPTPADFHSTGTSAVNPQPPAPAGGANGSRSGAPDTTQPVQVTSPASFSEGFVDITILPGWALQNNSSPLGSSNWFQGNPLVFNAQAGPTDSYIGANFNNTAGAGTISNWMMSPQLSLNNGDILTFWTRTVTSPGWPDRLQVRLSTAGASTNVGTLATDVGDFTTLLLDINPTLIVSGYPNVWTQYTIPLSGLPINASGRFAWRYFVTNGGPDGANSDYIGIDTVGFSGNPTAVTLASLQAMPANPLVTPALGGLAALAALAGAVLRGRRR